MPKPFFSIILPTYNSAKTVGRTMESILAQECTDYELLVMDGVSTDDTLAIIRAYDSEKVARIYSGPDKGVYDAMNKGIEAASGEWLYFLGSDDQLADARVLANIKKELQHAPCDILYGKARFVNVQKIHGEKWSLKKLVLVANICHQAIFYRRSVFDKIGGYDLQYPVWADYDFNIRCFTSWRIRHRYINRIIADYNDGEGLSKAHDRKFAYTLPEINYTRQVLFPDTIDPGSWPLRHRKITWKLWKVRLFFRRLKSLFQGAKQV